MLLWILITNTRWLFPDRLSVASVIYADLRDLHLRLQVNPAQISLIFLAVPPDIQVPSKRQLTHLSICLPIQSYFRHPEGRELLMSAWLTATTRLRWLTSDADRQLWDYREGKWQLVYLQLWQKMWPMVYNHLHIEQKDLKSWSAHVLQMLWNSGLFLSFGDLEKDFLLLFLSYGKLS